MFPSYNILEMLLLDFIFTSIKLQCYSEVKLIERTLSDGYLFICQLKT